MKPRSYYPPDPHCPICDRPVNSVIYNQYCVDPVVASVVYVHEGERHFIVFEPEGQDGLSLTHRAELSPA